MPVMNGIETAHRLKKAGAETRIVFLTVHDDPDFAREALEAGAIDFVTKPSTDVSRGLQQMIMELRTKVKIASVANVAHWKNKRPHIGGTAGENGKALAESTDKVIAIGASTGGTEAIRSIVTQFSSTMPGVVIVQHMPAGFTKMFADRLNSQCAMVVKEAETGDRIVNGRILMREGAPPRSTAQIASHPEVPAEALSACNRRLAS